MIEYFSYFFSASSSVGDPATPLCCCELDETNAQSKAALIQFKKQDAFFRPDTFEDFVEILENYRSESNLTGGRELADEMQLLLKNTMNAYYVSAQPIYQWCGVALNCFQSYLQRLQNTTKEAAMKQHRIVVEVLDDGFKKLHFAKQSLQKIVLSFDRISESALIPRLDADYDEYSAQSKQQIKRLESELKESRKGVLSVIRDNDKTRQLKSTINEIIRNLVEFEKLNNVLKQGIKEADLKAKEVRKNFENELNAVVDVNSQARLTLDIINVAIGDDVFDFEINSLIKISVRKFIEKCQTYRERHDV